MAKKLNILWTNDNPITVELMVFMYANNSLRHKWWDEVHLIVWGASVKLLAEDAKTQQLVKEFQELGGDITVCLGCCEKLCLVDAVKSLDGVYVEYVYLTQYIESNARGDEILITL